MKKQGWLTILAGFILIIGLLCPVQAEEQLPAEIQNMLAGTDIVKTAYWEKPGSTWFVFIRTPGGTNELLCFELHDGSWIQSFHTSTAVPQGKVSVERLHITDKVQDFDYNRTWAGPILMILTDDGSYTSYQRAGSGQWQLFKVFYHDEQTDLDFNDESIIYRTPIDQDHSRFETVYGSFERDLRRIDINTIPRSPQRAREMLGTDQAGTAENPSEASSGIIGSIVAFGRYEQDGNDENGPETIEWIVLDVRDRKILLLSRYGLDHLPYHTKDENITWEGCSLRKWLNNDFLQAAFTPEEQELIPETKVDNSKSQCFSRWRKAKGGNDTMDRVFLLSCTEAKQYLDVSWYGEGSDKALMELTEYAGRDAHRHIPSFEEEDGRTYWHWWLRSPGAEQTDLTKQHPAGQLLCRLPIGLLSGQDSLLSEAPVPGIRMAKEV